MKVTMNMSNYEIEHEMIDEEYDYGDEILCAGWNPEIDLVREQLQTVPTNETQKMPETLASEVAELFLRKMYSYQR